MSTNHSTSVPLFSHNTLASSGFFAPPLRVSRVKKTAESLVLCVMCGCVCVCGCGCCGCVCVCGCGCGMDVAVAVAAAVVDTVAVDVTWIWLWMCMLLLSCDECLVIQRVISRAFQPLTTVDVKTRTFFFIKKKFKKKKIIPRNYSTRIRRATKTSVRYRKISNPPQHPVVTSTKDVVILQAVKVKTRDSVPSTFLHL